MTVDLATKNRVFAMLKARGAIKAVLSYNGGNDEGGVDQITLWLETAGETIDLPTAWQATGDDEELATLLEGPVDAKYGTWAGDFSAYGQLIWDALAGTVVMEDYVQDSYEYSETEF